MGVYIEQIYATCETYSYDGNNRDFCFGLYMNAKCYKEFARKYCERCDEFNAFEKYVNDYIISIENGECSKNPSQPCDSNSSTITIPITMPTTIAGPTIWTTPSNSDPNTTTTQPESTTAKDSCDS
jgi:hypothetical protein